MTWEFWEIFTRALESLEIGTLWDSFVQSRKCMSLKFTGELFFMTMKKRCKTGRGIDLSFQNWHEDFDEFWPEHLKISKICPLMGCLSTKYTVFKLKKYRGVMFDGTGHWCKIWTKIDFCFQKWHEEFGKFSPEHLKVSKFELFDGILLSKVWAWNLQESYLSWQWKKMQNWKRNWFVVSKLTWGLWWILTRALEYLKTLHFNGIFLIKVCNVWAEKVQRSYIWWH